MCQSCPGIAQCFPQRLPHKVQCARTYVRTYKQQEVTSFRSYRIAFLCVNHAQEPLNALPKDCNTRYSAQVHTYNRKLRHLGLTGLPSFVSIMPSNCSMLFPKISTQGTVHAYIHTYNRKLRHLGPTGLPSYVSIMPRNCSMLSPKIATQGTVHAYIDTTGSYIT